MKALLLTATVVRDASRMAVPCVLSDKSETFEKLGRAIGVQGRGFHSHKNTNSHM